MGACKVVTKQHPVYKIEYRNDNGNAVEKWVTRDKICRCEKSAVYRNIYKPDIKSDNQKEPELCHE